MDKKAYQDARNIYILKLKTAKCRYFNMVVEETQGNRKKLFGLFDSLTKEPKGNLMPLGSEALLAKGFAGFFQEKNETICKSFNLTDGLKVPFTHPNHLPRMSSFKEVSLGEKTQLLSKAKPTTYLLDTIPTKLLKAYPEVFLTLITRLLNLTLTSGIFPCICKRAIVKPLLKKTGLEKLLKFIDQWGT